MGSYSYVAYLRQSTTKQERSGLGIEAQRDIIGKSSVSCPLKPSDSAPLC